MFAGIDERTMSNWQLEESVYCSTFAYAFRVNTGQCNVGVQTWAIEELLHTSLLKLQENIE